MVCKRLSLPNCPGLTTKVFPFNVQNLMFLTPDVINALLRFEKEISKMRSPEIASVSKIPSNQFHTETECLTVRFADAKYLPSGEKASAQNPELSEFPKIQKINEDFKSGKIENILPKI
ncbi:hypothetical protein LOD99_8193 [Oopsacas minuta]|uniref:Uncharacterized protein n=1 Tax=Oopsacas minuta TaxID=111878 RepID=A0AAV7JHQ2_9METZ|nr:hypothetical protein LOD99_8193 [Oopsacas minuta]